MHLPTPHLKKSDNKRKASLDSLAPQEDAPVLIEKKTSKSKKKAKTTKAKKDKTAMPDDTLVHHATSSSPPARSRSPSLTALPRKDSGTDLQPTTTTSTNPEPRRSSRIKASMHTVAETWTKARPYIERINGTIMPLEHQGTSAYYTRDGVKVD